MFIPQILKITDWKTRLTADRVGFLHDIVKAFVINIPFQNITCIGSVDVRQRRPPSFEDALMAGLTSSGGLCGHINTFLQHTLKSLGYDAYLAAGNFRRTGIPGSHVLCLVKIPYTKRDKSRVEFLSDNKDINSQPKDESKWYIVDPGCSAVLHEPISVSDLPYHGRAAGLNFRYEKSSDGLGIQRVHDCGDALVGPKPKDFLCPQDYTIDLKPIKKFSSFQEPVAKYFNNHSLPLHTSLYCFRYLKLTESDFEVVWLRGTDLIISTKETRQVTSFQDYYEMEPIIKKYFPMIKPSDVDIAIETFSEALAVSKMQKQQQKS